MNPNDLPNDEIRRQLRAIDRANTEAMPKWREVLTRIMARDDRLTADEKAAILGVPSPSRRNLFKFGRRRHHRRRRARRVRRRQRRLERRRRPAAGGAGHDGWRGDDDGAGHDDGARDHDGARRPRCAGDDRGRAAANMDLVLAKTAASLEKLAVDAYGAAGALLTTPAIMDAATMFAGHHQMHLDALNGVITGAGADAVTEMNQAVYDALVKPAIDAAKTEADAVNLALALEEAAAQTYVFAGGALSTPDLRSTIMTIGGVEARHAAVLRMAALAQSPLDVFPTERAFLPGDNPLAGIDGALITT